MATRRYEITAGPSKFDLMLSVFDGKVVRFTFSELGEKEVSIWNIDTQQLAEYGFVMIRGSFKEEGSVFTFEGSYSLSGDGIDSSIQVTAEWVIGNLEQEEASNDDPEDAEGCELCGASLADPSQRFCLSPDCQNELQMAREEEERNTCKECGKRSYEVSEDGLCVDCEREQYEKEYADGMETEADFQASRQ